MSWGPNGGSNPKLLASGTITNALANIFLATTPTTISSFRLFSTNAAQQTVIVEYRSSAGTVTKLGQYVLNQNEWADETFAGPLGAGDSIQAVTTTSTGVDFTICGNA